VTRDVSATYSDHFSFWLAGYPSILLIEADPHSAEYPLTPYYHTEDDTSDSISEEQLTEVTKALLYGLLGLFEPKDEMNPVPIVITGTAAILATATLVFLYRRTRKGGTT
jgi:Zn-dependent M28 family amino/carboxypeptidase